MTLKQKREVAARLIEQLSEVPDYAVLRVSWFAGGRNKYPSHLLNCEPAELLAILKAFTLPPPTRKRDGR